MNQSAAADLNIIRVRAEEKDFFAEEVHEAATEHTESAEFIFRISALSVAILLFCRQNPANDFGHDKFAVAFEPFLCDCFNLFDQGFVFVIAVEHGCP